MNVKVVHLDAVVL